MPHNRPLTPADIAVRKETNLRRLLTMLAAFVLFLGVMTGLVVLKQVREHVLEEARTAARDSAQLLEEHAKRVFRRPDYGELFADFHASLPLGSHAVTGVHFTDGRILFHQPPGAATLTPDDLASALATADDGVIEPVDSADGVQRIWAYRRVPQLGVVVVAGVSVEVALSDYRLSVKVVTLAGLVGGGLMVGLLILAFRSLLNEERLIRDLERTVEMRTKEARDQAETAKRANESKTRFLAAASHDLRQPLQAAGMFIEVLSGRIDEPKSAGIVLRLRQSIDATSALLTALLDVSILEEGRVRPNIRAVPVAPILASLVDQFEPEASARNLEIRVVPSSAWVMTDPVLFERALRNLIVNAIRYTVQGKVLLGCRRQGKSILVQVIDTGIGIPSERHQAIFEDFTRFDDDKGGSGCQGSLGLGLAVVRRTALLLGHSVKVRSEPGKGSVFSIGVTQATAPATYSNSIE